MTELENYAWPGNIRELENLMERLAIIGEGRLVDAVQISNLLRYRRSSAGFSEHARLEFLFRHGEADRIERARTFRLDTDPCCKRTRNNPATDGV